MRDENSLKGISKKPCRVCGKPVIYQGADHCSAKCWEKDLDKPKEKLRFVILVTGSRDYGTPEEEDLIIKTLKPYVGSDVILIHGACHLGGADKLCAEFAEFYGWKVIAMPAKDYGKWPECGPNRNTAMVVKTLEIGGLEKRAMRCHAFPRLVSVGTVDCSTKAERAGILTSIHKVGDR